MGKSAAKKRRLQQHAATIRRKNTKYEDKYKEWEGILRQWDEMCQTLHNPKGKSRTYEQNSMLLLATKAKLSILLDQVADDPLAIFNINWTRIDKSVAKDFKADVNHVSALRKSFVEEGVVLVQDT